MTSYDATPEMPATVNEVADTTAVASGPAQQQQRSSSNARETGALDLSQIPLTSTTGSAMQQAVSVVVTATAVSSSLSLSPSVTAAVVSLSETRCARPSSPVLSPLTTPTTLIAPLFMSKSEPAHHPPLPPPHPPHPHPHPPHPHPSHPHAPSSPSSAYFSASAAAHDARALRKRLKESKRSLSKNRYGRCFVNGRPLSVDLRERILELKAQNIRPCEISRRLQISHGCVSKILSKFKRTGCVMPGQIGGSKPKVATPAVIRWVRRLKDEEPHLYAWEIRKRLLDEVVCHVENCPSISSINRIVRQRGHGFVPVGLGNDLVMAGSSEPSDMEDDSIRENTQHRAPVAMSEECNTSSIKVEPYLKIYDTLDGANDESPPCTGNGSNGKGGLLLESTTTTTIPIPCEATVPYDVVPAIESNGLCDREAPSADAAAAADSQEQQQAVAVVTPSSSSSLSIQYPLLPVLNTVASTVSGDRSSDHNNASVISTSSSSSEKLTVGDLHILEDGNGKPRVIRYCGSSRWLLLSQDDLKMQFNKICALLNLTQSS